MNLPKHLVDLLEDTLVSGLRLRLGDVDRFKEKFRKDPEKFLISLILSAKKDALAKSSVTTEFTLWGTVSTKGLEEARNLIEEWGKETVATH